MGNIHSIISGPSTLETCLKAALPSNQVAGPSKVDYLLSDVKPFNLAIPVKPIAVTYPTSAEQVAAAVKCATKYSVKVQAKSGGHSYGNYAYGGGAPDTMVLDLKNMKDFEWDASGSWVAHAGAGNLLGDLTKKMKDDGNRAFAHGTCPSVGIGGHLTIGGLGPQSRQWGSALDHVQSATVVLANGDIVKASADENQDLLWATKGAGASFGIVTQFDIITHAPPSETVSYSYTFASKPYSNHATRFKAWQKLIADPNLTRKFATQVIFSELGMIIEGTYFGSKSEFDTLNITSVLPGSTTSDVLVLNDWLGQVSNWAENGALKIVGGISNTFYAKSLAFRAQDLIPDSGIDAFLAYMDKTPKGTLIWFAIFDLEGGAINDVASDATAYGHRDALFYFQPYVSNLILPLSQTSTNFLNGLTKTLTNAVPATLSNGAYAGYVDPQLGDGAQKAYWGSNYERLQELKSVYDPTDVFSNPQSVKMKS